jgi:hypothetical protein
LQRKKTPKTAAEMVSALPSQVIQEVDKADPVKKEWYYDQAGSPQGPMTFEELKRLIRKRILRRETLILKPGFPGWVTVEEILGVETVKKLEEKRKKRREKTYKVTRPPWENEFLWNLLHRPGSC